MFTDLFPSVYKAFDDLRYFVSQNQVVLQKKGYHVTYRMVDLYVDGLPKIAFYGAVASSSMPKRYSKAFYLTSSDPEALEKVIEDFLTALKFYV